MLLLSVDDFVFEDHGIEPALVTKESAHLNFGSDRRAGSYASVFFGSSTQPASWQAKIKTPDQATRDALMAVLAAPSEEQLRLVADLEVEGVEGEKLVTIDASVGSVRWPGSGWNLEVTFQSNDSIWLGLETETASKTFSSALDQIMYLPAPGNVPTQPVIRITPTEQRSATTAAVGWQYRQRWMIANMGDEPLFRYPVLIPLGDTTGLTTAKALASGDDLRVWLHGLEQARTLVDWDTSATGVWVIVPALPPGAAITYEIVYGNANANSATADGVVLAGSDLPAFDLDESTNYQHCYLTATDVINAGKGLWPLSSPLEGGSADYGAPGAWQPALTFENPNNTDEYVQPRAQRMEDAAGPWYQARLYAARWRGPGWDNFDPYAGADPYDGVVLHNPFGIRAVRADSIRYRNDAYDKTTVTTTVGNTTETSEVLAPADPPYTRVAVIGRNSGGETWHVLQEYANTTIDPLNRLYLQAVNAASISPTPAAGWEQTVGVSRYAAITQPTVVGATLLARNSALITDTFGSSGSGTAPNFNGPHQVAVDSSGNVYIADTANNRVVKLNSDGAYVSSFSVTAARGVAVDSSGNIYVSQSGGKVLKYNSAFSLQWQTTVNDTFGHIATDGTYVFAVSRTISVIYRFDVSDGDQSAVWGSLGSGNGQFTKPEGIATDGTHVYVGEDDNTRVQKFDVDGNYVTKWGSAGTGDGEFSAASGAWGIALDASGNVWVADYGNNRIQRFSNTGTYQRSRTITNPVGVAAPSDGVIWASSYTGDHLKRFTDVATSTDDDILLAQYVYPLPPGVAFTTSDTVKGQIRAKEIETADDVRAQTVIRVMTADGTVRATLLNFDTASLSSEFGTTLTNRKFPRGGAVNLVANYTSVDGDYLVIEYGARQHSSGAIDLQMSLGVSGESDLPEDETETSALNPWIEFSTDLSGDGYVTDSPSWTPPSPVKHFGVACWPSDVVSIPEDSESRVSVESTGDVTVHIAAEPLVITRIEAETEIYELATELRIGGGNAVGPYHTLLIGNARGLSGPGTPRAALALGTRGLEIDTERHTHTIWDDTFTTQAEALSTHTVRAMAGSLREVDAADVPALERIALTVPNSTFDSDLTGWELHQDDADWTYAVTYDATAGGETAGSLEFAVTVADESTVLYRSTTYHAVATDDSVEVTCWLSQDAAGSSSPRVGVAWYDANPTLIQTDLDSMSAAILNPGAEHTLVYAGTPPAGVTQFRVVLGITAEDDTTTTKYFDDVTATIIRPVRYDGAISKVTEEQRSARWLPIAPPRRTVPNGDFATDLTGWALEDDGTGITYAATHDAAVGGVANGSLSIDITANTGSDSVIYRTTAFFAVNGAERVEMSAWCLTDEADLHPRLAILWYGDADDTLLATSLEDDWQPVAATEYVRSFAAIVPPGMTRFRLGLVADTAVSTTTGEVHFDDIRLNDADLFIADVAMSEMDVAAIVQPRWTP